jgi:biopolymer transport protein ExbB/TolQ
MVIRVKLSALKQGHWYEYLVRFALGGSATVVAGVVAEIWGPTAGGLFLAFPAIFCASATLIEKHERQEKEKKGLKGKERGKNAAALDAAGAAMGSAGLAGFGAVMWLLAIDTAAGSLALATAIWFAVSVLLWRVRRELRVYRT